MHLIEQKSLLEIFVKVLSYGIYMHINVFSISYHLITIDRLTEFLHNITIMPPTVV